MLRQVLSRAALARVPAQRKTALRAATCMMRPFSTEGEDSSSSSSGKKSKKGSNASRFLKLADQIDTSEVEPLAPGEEVLQSAADFEEEFFIDLNPDGVGLDEADNIRIFDEYMADPLVNTIQKLATNNRVSVERIEATIVFQGLERGHSINELREKVFNIKQEKEKESKEAAKGVKNPVAAVNGKGGYKPKTAAPSISNSLNEAEDGVAAILTNEEWEEAHRPEEIREPNFLFLRDDMLDELPPLTRQSRKVKGSDKVTVPEAIALQRGAEKNIVTLLPSFAKNLNPTGKFKIAIKDISKKKAPLYMRDTDGSYRLASDDEVTKRSWVKRPPFFQGIERYM
ncbi:Aste57867_11100 [Aphanomyces stellatus]|uniref:Aste57867_11100 protein n=1 Tax=Aphanomyces stellatus TaxID=120398 RepID=A0A485KTX9_9STRA|nr:hypothetical protein As57867_011058 [Aphanomyces stellatus]VFT87967.1 Aste57867_11100 [Aphanomyces stellatus]